MKARKKKKKSNNSDTKKVLSRIFDNFRQQRRAKKEYIFRCVGDNNKLGTCLSKVFTEIKKQKKKKKIKENEIQTYPWLDKVPAQ